MKTDNTNIACPLSVGMCSARKGNRKKRKDNKTTQCHPQEQKSKKKTELFGLKTAQKTNDNTRKKAQQ